MDFSAPDYDDLIKRYIDVCNRAIMLNHDRFPFKQILGAAKNAEGSKIIEVRIKEGSPDLSYAMTFDQEGLVARPHSTCTECQCDRKWGVSKSYLEDVTKNPEDYIQNPAKLDWEWMYDVSTE